MTDRGPPVLTTKAIRAKFANQTKIKEPPQKNPPKQNPSKTAPPLEPRVIVVPVVPVDQPEDQAPFYPPNQPNPPENPPDPSPKPHQIYQINHLTLQQIHPIQCSHKSLHPKCHN